MYPLIPGDALITTEPPMYTLDGRQLALTEAEAARLLVLAPRLAGRLPLEDAISASDDAALIRQLYERGVVYDLPTTGDTVPTGLFCDYLYARVTCWRMNKDAATWPWRAVIADGGAHEGYLQGILIENYH